MALLSSSDQVQNSIIFLQISFKITVYIQRSQVTVERVGACTRTHHVNRAAPDGRSLRFHIRLHNLTSALMSPLQYRNCLVLINKSCFMNDSFYPTVLFLTYLTLLGKIFRLVSNSPMGS